ncbi:MAG: hypothetical protein R2812_09325 [Gelidibacter sp.]
MKLLLFFFSLCFFSLSQAQPSKVVPFLDSIVTQFPNVRDLAMSPNKDEVVFSAQSFMGDVSALMYIKKEENNWSSPQIISFSGQFFDIEPYFSSDGLTLYFASNRPINTSSSTVKDFDIWLVTRKTIHEQWSKPVNLGAPINSDLDEFYPVITQSKNLYFTLDKPELKQKDNIYVSTFNNGTYTTPEPLSNAINSDGYEFNAYVAPDESFLIYTKYNASDGFGSGDLYISHKQKNGGWSTAKNMGNTINSDKMEYCPFLDTDSKTLYFTSKRNGTSAKFDSQLSTEALLKTFYSYDNGLSRLYKTNIEQFLAH